MSIPRWLAFPSFISSAFLCLAAQTFQVRGLLLKVG